MIISLVFVSLLTWARANAEVAGLGPRKIRYENMRASIIETSKSETGKLNGQYSIALDSLLVKYKNNSSLEQIVAIQEEIDRLKAGGDRGSKNTMPPNLRALRDAYDAKFDALKAAELRQRFSAAQSYDADLKVIQDNFNGTNKLEVANLLQIERNSLLPEMAIIKEWKPTQAPTTAPTEIPAGNPGVTNAPGKSFANRDPVFGVWEYKYRGKTYRREFTEDKKCILTQDGKVIWERPYKMVNSKRAQVTHPDKQKGNHEINRDGTLLIEDEFVGRKISTN